ncbi:hypothetical protein [Pedobacter hiemivivus]|uniref:Uncharacterized protein n=1 Tax=Pedobacter hiemivivus TaxID=2530454 RepID=A0A4R0NEB9_9SPHI|nr:hypothetical protein [Pedobacter hiemivivus]TCC98789.1 hypothetical protein EZ444_05810 [Pedobacter hiemivivus]
MNDIKSLADQLRSSIISPPAGPESKTSAEGKPKKQSKAVSAPAILEEIRDYDNADHKNMVHVRFDKKTAQLLSHFKMATGIDLTKLIAFSVRRLLTQHPEIKSIVQQYIQNLEL